MAHPSPAAEDIKTGQVVLGIELGSTRIKAVLTGQDHQPLASGFFQWENQFKDGLWTYDLQQAVLGVQAAYQALKAEVQKLYGLPLHRLAGLGISAMMHGYLALDKEGSLLTPFRTWRNSNTAQAADLLGPVLNFALPLRWGISHLYQAILDDEEHLPRLHHITTLSGYIHFLLTGQAVLGVGDASGIFPLDEGFGYDRQGLWRFDALIRDKGYPWQLSDLLPSIKLAGQQAGTLSEEGALLLDPSGQLLAGCPLCPPEGDAGTGMVATNAVSPRSGNLSAGTSIFAMVVLEKPFKKPLPGIDIVATPSGQPVAMVHCNNGSSNLNAWVALFLDFAQQAGLPLTADQAYQLFFQSAQKGQADAGGLTSMGYFSGEHLTGFAKGQPLLSHPPDSTFSFANLARSILYANLATLALGMEQLAQEQVHIDRISAHGGLYKGNQSAKELTAAALNTRVLVMDGAEEGGAYGISLLAAYRVWRQTGQSLADYLNQQVFVRQSSSEQAPLPEDRQGFLQYLERFKKMLLVEASAVEQLS